MRGTDQQQTHVFSYISPEQRVRKDHPLRPIRRMVDEILKQLSPQFNKMYAKVGRPPNFHGKKTFEPGARIKKRSGSAAGPQRERQGGLSYSGNLLVENRNGLIVSSLVWEATGTAERDAPMAMLA